MVRYNLLKAMSYNVEMIEFVGFKNLLIRANLTRIPLDVREKYLQEVVDLKTAFNFEQNFINY